MAQQLATGDHHHHQHHQQGSSTSSSSSSNSAFDGVDRARWTRHPGRVDVFRMAEFPGRGVLVDDTNSLVAWSRDATGLWQGMRLGACTANVWTTVTFVQVGGCAGGGVVGVCWGGGGVERVCGGEGRWGAC